MSAARPALACVVGHPAAHSRSPLIHNYWLARYRIAGAYLARDVKPQDLEGTLASLAREGFRGASITVPHKQAAFRLVQNHDAAAGACRAVNAVVCEKRGALSGLNTDGFGFLENLRSAYPSFRAGRAAIFGAGGAARAIAHALPALGVREIRIVNRTPVHAEALARDLASPALRFALYDWDEAGAALEGAGLAVNATSLGMRGSPPLAPDFSPLARGALVADAVYAPPRTPFLERAGMGGFATLDGLGMLVHQARPAFRAWFGIKPEVTEELMALLRRDLREET